MPNIRGSEKQQELLTVYFLKVTTKKPNVQKVPPPLYFGNPKQFCITKVLLIGLS